jgi:hypothetical protein
LGDSTKLVGDLLKIQGLFFETSEYKNGPKAGKVNLEQFYKVIDQSGFFSSIPLDDYNTKCNEYFGMLDVDKDQMVGFFDFITPVMSMLPPEVSAAFQNDQRFKQESLNDLR